ncbi:FAD-binding oxidoreductase [Streptomyces sp. 7-21]|uniref:FAD-binding oxidoreductase n=1 Tax=Streptomyces sp. 7-21 TaxID=2802283 RepID=UPI00191EB0C8|nr:FAD-binding protein [Streptomyces sp. 7-21]MBL1065941.1 FAD-binding protein [Streptomyces sp. 7-21]
MRIEPGDPRYSTLVRGYNQRFRAAPGAVHLVRTTQEAVAAVEEALRGGKRLSVRSGGHCYADLVYHRDTELIVDLSLMTNVTYDPRRRAFMAEAGARLTDVYATLHRGWGVLLPGGVCPHIGLGGHLTGGGYGYHSRRYGVAADHVEAVEVVVADQGDRARAVIASRGSHGTLHDLWWAVCGGGGGTFGIVTRFWLRAPWAEGGDPLRQLPPAPQEVLISMSQRSWEGLSQAEFTRLLRNFGRWCERHVAAGPPQDALSATLVTPHRSSGALRLIAVIDAGVPGARAALDRLAAEVGAGTALVTAPHRRLPWAQAERLLSATDPETMVTAAKRVAVKSGYHRAAFTEEQGAAAYRHLTREDYGNPLARVLYFAAGSRLNAVPRDTIAYVHRDSSFAAQYEVFWTQPQEDSLHLNWLRGLYGEVYAATGGYPVPDGRTGGCYINSPDPDILDPRYNASKVPWQAFYWRENYPRLQRAKARWDPDDVFRHALSVRLP